ncbi:MAG: hypothetical protein ACTS3F_10815 [Phycisphaerales bacterium]
MFWAMLQANIPATDPDRLLIVPHARVFDAFLPAPRWGRFDLWVDISDIGNARWSLPYGGPIGDGMNRWMHLPASFDLSDRAGDGDTVELKCIITWCDRTDSCVQLRSATQLDRSRIPRDTPRPRPDRFIAAMLADPDAWRVMPSTNPFSKEAVLRWRSPDAPRLEYWPGDPPLAPPIAAARAAGLTVALRIELLANDGDGPAWRTESLLASSSHALRTDGSLHIYFTPPDQLMLREPIRLRITPDPELAAMDIGAQAYWTDDPIEIVLPPTAVQPTLSRR